MSCHCKFRSGSLEKEREAKAETEVKAAAMRVAEAHIAEVRRQREKSAEVAVEAEVRASAIRARAEAHKAAAASAAATAIAAHPEAAKAERMVAAGAGVSARNRFSHNRRIHPKSRSVEAKAVATPDHSSAILLILQAMRRRAMTLPALAHYMDTDRYVTGILFYSEHFPPCTLLSFRLFLSTRCRSFPLTFVYLLPLLAGTI